MGLETAGSSYISLAKLACVQAASFPSSVELLQGESVEMREGNIVMTWIAILAVIAVVLGCLVFFSDGPVPYFKTDEVHVPPFWG
jgi:hypothetical protein